MIPSPSAMATAILSALLLGILLLSGCAEGVYEHRLIPPDTPEGQSCLSNCELIRNQCEGRQQAREKECLDRYASTRSEYDICTESGSKRCVAPSNCAQADIEICRTQYQECFTNCGGRVEKTFAGPRLDPKSAPEPASAKHAAGDPP